MVSSVTTEQRAQILDRLITLKDYSPLILIRDSVEQSAERLLSEFERRKPEGYKSLHLARGFAPPAKLEVPDAAQSQKTLVFIHDISLIEGVAHYLQKLVHPNTTVIGVLHEDIEYHSSAYEPDPASLLNYMATTVLRVVANDQCLDTIIEDPMTRLFYSSPYFNSSRFNVIVESRRRSGRSTTATFSMDSESHAITYKPPAKDAAGDDAALLAGMTTFNLALTDKQREDKNSVALPFLSAQEVGQGGAAGGAIIYEFEKDDDYDEEDPYEDPF